MAHPIPDGSARAPDPATDQLVNGPPTHTAECSCCKEDIERMSAGHWRLAARVHAAPLDQTRDRIHCDKSPTGYHHPPYVDGRAVMKRVSPPWSGGRP